MNPRAVIPLYLSLIAGMLPAAPAFGETTANSIVQQKVRGLENKDARLRKESAHFLAERGGASALPALLKALQDPDKEVRVSVIMALASRKEAGALPGLLPLFGDEDAQIRLFALKAFLQISNVNPSSVLDPVPSLARLLQDPEEEIRVTALDALSKPGDRRIAEALLLALQDPSPAVRAKAADGLRATEDASSIPVLKTMVQDQDPQVRKSVAAALVLGGMSSLPVLSGMLRDAADAVAVQAAVAIHEIGDPGGKRALQAMLKGKNAKLRFGAALALFQILEDKSGVPALIAMLQDPDPMARMSAARLLKADKMGGRPAVIPLTKALGDPHPKVRFEAAISLGELADPVAIPFLKRALVQEQDPEVRMEIAGAFGAIGDKKVCRLLIRTLQHELAAPVRIAALNSLDKLNEPPPLPVLLSILSQRTESKEVRIRILEWLSSRGCRPASSTIRGLLREEDAELRTVAARILGTLGDRTFTPDLLALLKDPEARVVKGALWGLRYMGDPSAAEDLLVLVNSAGIDPEIRLLATMTLGFAGDARAVAGLLTTATDPRELLELRNYAIQSLGLLGDPSALPALKELSHPNQDISIRRSACEALGKFGDPAVSAILEAAIQDPEETIRMHALLAMKERGNRSGAAALVARMQGTGPSKPEQLLICELLGRTKDPRARECLQHLWDHENGAVKEAAGRALYSPGATEILTYFLRMARDRDSTDRGLKALGELEDPSALPVVAGFLRSKDSRIRRSAVEAIGRVGNRSLIPRLRNMIGKGDPLLDVAIAESLVRLGDASALPHLFQAMDSEHEKNVRLEAMEAVLRLKGKPLLGSLQALVERDGCHEIRRKALEMLMAISRHQDAPEASAS